MLYRNVSRVDQMFYDPGGGPMVVIPSGWVYSSNLIPDVKGHPSFRAFEGFAEYMKHSDPSRPEYVGIIRSFALGDVLMVMSVLRSLRKVWPHLIFDFYTEERFFPVFEGFKGRDEGIRYIAPSNSPPGLKYGIGLNFDGVLEKDHSRADFHTKHRLRILAEFLGVEDVLDVQAG